ncbi:MAG: LPS export ABC transporter periplasmic protein LptC [Tannerellaceae bacterium]|jgi:LPS export ABC transporter protein LptC|nr:LPS export ABC transporter periplasmic protein LptC [Tannerellaceae bacterium]
MFNERFIRKTNKQGITTIPVMVVMLLLFSVSCSKEKKETVEVLFDPEQTYTMRTTDVLSLVSDSGITRYRINTKEWLTYGKAAEPYHFFPQGIYIEKFDTLFHIEASIKADTAYWYEKKGLLKGAGNVQIENLEGEFFETSLLYWDQKTEKIYTDRYIHIITKQKKEIEGIGFESNQNMTKYDIFDTSGTFTVEDTAPADSTDTNAPPDNK